ncbi:MAG: acyltransferase [Candidatus Hodarchaeota archaeon]
MIKVKSWKEFSVAVRRRETPFYEFLFRLAKCVRILSFPCVRPLHSILYAEWSARTSLWHNFWRIAYYEPMFKSQCASVGSGFRMEYAGHRIAEISGDLQLHIGANVTIFDNTAFAGLKILDKPELHIGDDTYIGPFVRIAVGRKVTIGHHCLITSRLITDNPGHSFKNVLSRLESSGGSPAPEDIRPVAIGDFCFLPLDTFVYPGVTVGDGVLARVGTHINRDVPPFCLVAGNPARIVRKLSIPPRLMEIVGRERYESYLAAHQELNVDENGR